MLRFNFCCLWVSSRKKLLVDVFEVVSDDADPKLIHGRLEMNLVLKYMPHSAECHAMTLGIQHVYLE